MSQRINVSSTTCISVSSPRCRKIRKLIKAVFFPNNDVHPARRMRIIKALEYGATWQKDWTNSVTHVIVDKSIYYGQLIAFLKMSALPVCILHLTETDLTKNHRSLSSS